MTPDFKILADTKDVTATIRGRFSSLTITDEAGQSSDAAELRLDDRAPHITLPRTGAKLDIAIGYRETGVARIGIYTVDEINLEGPPDTLAIRARAADLRKSLKSPNTRSFDNVTIGDLVAAIAAQHEFKYHVDASLADISFAHIDQTEESDIHLLTRLAKDHGAVAKAAGDTLLFVPRGAAKSAEGKMLPAVTLTRQDLTRWRVTIADRGKYGAVIAYWHDTASGERVEVKVGDGEPVYTIRRTYPEASVAKNAASAKLSEFVCGAATLSGNGPGDSRLAAEGKLTITGVREGINGTWTLTRVTHTIDGQGYRCGIEAESEDAA